MPDSGTTLSTNILPVLAAPSSTAMVSPFLGLHLSHSSRVSLSLSNSSSLCLSAYISW